MTRTRHLRLSAYSPLVASFFLLAGLIVSTFFPVTFWYPTVALIGGIVLVIGGTFIMWLAFTTRKDFFAPITDITCYDFYQGIYKYSRHPEYLGTLLVFIGFSLIANSAVFLAIVVVYFIFFTWIFIPLEEREIEKHCKEVYVEYKNKVRMWI